MPKPLGKLDLQETDSSQQVGWKTRLFPCVARFVHLEYCRHQGWHDRGMDIVGESCGPHDNIKLVSLVESREL